MAVLHKASVLHVVGVLVPIPLLLWCRWGLANAERMMVKPDQLQLVTLVSRKGHTGEVRAVSCCARLVSCLQQPMYVDMNDS